MTDKIVYLMRGLPSCGKSHTAKKLAGTLGRIFETDQFFYTEVGEDPQQFDFRSELMDSARSWNFERFQTAIQCGESPIVVDRGNGLNLETQAYARYAIDHHYAVELCEPDSPWWQEIRVLLRYKDHVDPRLLDGFAKALAEKSKSTHRVPLETIRRWMNAWRDDLTVDDILQYQE